MEPRLDGHARVHHVSDGVSRNSEEYEPCLTDEELADGLTYLRLQNADLRRGDIIVFDELTGYRSDGLAFFDGEQIIHPEDEPDDYGTIPRQFQVITNGVPIDYWHGAGDASNLFDWHNNYVWFDHRDVVDQCLTNIQYQRLQNQPTEKWAVQTHFNYESRPYRIVFDCSQEAAYYEKIKSDTCKFHNLDLAERACDDLQNILNRPGMLPFSVYSSDGDYASSSNILFVDTRYMDQIIPYPI